MTDGKKRPTRRNVRSDLDDLRDAARADDDDMPDVTITTYGVDRAKNVDDVDADEGVVLFGGGTCLVDGCDAGALAGADRCPYHYDGDSDAASDE